MTTKELSFQATESAGDVSALWLRPRGATAAYVLGHGAGAGMKHAFMESIAQHLAERKIATFRYQFPYMEQGKKRPDSPKVVEETIRNAVTAASKLAKGLPMIAGGKSFGGRLTSTAQAKEPLPGVLGLAFLGFPLHAPGKPSDTRAAHLDDIRVPMLFLQGTRDSLADLTLLEPVCKKLKKRSTLHIVDGADHGFHVLKRTGRTDDEVLEELAERISTWTLGLLE